ncbi:heme/hemin ABC transporter substrate-binding protein [Jiella marina]|uniref:heme/hemin ABC transporter substrate-binding protein n=1 Tax=Jiella sp. LLJ827 TaxID=2917712 RepID=UPI002100D9CF|nr:ABC transporter substrate-binding protein [Jiella sp. LLJ827]MCQ0987055.1 ABC transporter substrate-binding protein [Jiella sp. LLJ827]
MKIHQIFGMIGLAFGLIAASPSFADEGSDPQRIVSVGGAVTEIVYALGHGDAIVGVDSTSTYPPEARAKPDVGYMRQLSAEGVIALQPDLLLIEQGSGPAEALSLLKASGVPVITVPSGHEAGALRSKIATVAEALGEEEAGAELGQTVMDELASLKADLEAIEDRKRVLFILSLADGRPTAGGSGTGADAMIEMAGGLNVFADVEGYKRLSSESVATLRPEVIVMMDRGTAAEHGSTDPFAIPALAASPAGEAEALIRMDALFLLGFGPRTPAAARELAAKLYPERIEAGSSESASQ